jgi:hypothetical protein
VAFGFRKRKRILPGLFVTCHGAVPASVWGDVARASAEAGAVANSFRLAGRASSGASGSSAGRRPTGPAVHRESRRRGSTLGRLECFSASRRPEEA